GNISSHEQRVLFQILDLFSKGSTFRELASLSAINVETSETQTTNTQQQIATQFLTHLQNYMKLMGLNNENELKLNLDNARSEEHTSELQSRFDLVCRLLLEKKKNT